MSAADGSYLSYFYNVHRAHSALAYNPPVSCLDRNNVLARDS
jgi:hypothetical protein